MLTRWDPFTALGELRPRFDRLFDEWLDGRERARTPAIDVVREDGHVVVRADLPGIKPEEVKIEVEDHILTVSGEHQESKEEKDKNYVRRERRYGSSRPRWRCRLASMPRTSRQRRTTASSK
jgi:HSP20 family protein